MVKKESSVYLFIGQDSFSKGIKLKRIKEEFLAKEIADFNLDILYAKELNLRDLQERLLYFPLNPVRNIAQKNNNKIVSNGVKAKKRIIVIKDAQEIKEDIKEFILKYVKNPPSKILLILDIDRQDPKDEFIKRITRYSEIYRFREHLPPDTFTLSRAIDLKKPDYALQVLNQLLQNGERPERILGGLRYTLERGALKPLQIRKRLKVLLDCDIEIKTGRLKAAFALERLLVRLCCLEKPSY